MEKNKILILLLSGINLFGMNYNKALEIKEKNQKIKTNGTNLAARQGYPRVKHLAHHTIYQCQLHTVRATHALKICG